MPTNAPRRGILAIVVTHWFRFGHGLQRIYGSRLVPEDQSL